MAGQRWNDQGSELITNLQLTQHFVACLTRFQFVMLRLHKVKFYYMPLPHLTSLVIRPPSAREKSISTWAICCCCWFFRFFYIKCLVIGTTNLFRAARKENSSWCWLWFLFIEIDDCATRVTTMNTIVTLPLSHVWFDVIKFHSWTFYSLEVKSSFPSLSRSHFSTHTRLS